MDAKALEREREREREAFAAEFGAFAPASLSEAELQHNAERAKHLPAPPVRALRLTSLPDGALRVRALPRLRKPVIHAPPRASRERRPRRRASTSSRGSPDEPHELSVIPPSAFRAEVARLLGGAS